MTLGLDSKLSLEGLTDGLFKALKQSIVLNGSKTASEWRSLVHRIE